jgi:hypothetical protein
MKKICSWDLEPVLVFSTSAPLGAFGVRQSRGVPALLRALLVTTLLMGEPGYEE